MCYVHAEIIKVLKSLDGNSELEILHRNDGFFEYRAHIMKVEVDGPLAGASSIGVQRCIPGFTILQNMLNGTRDFRYLG